MKYIGALIICVSLAFLVHLNSKGSLDLNKLSFLRVGIKSNLVTDQLGSPTKKNAKSWSYSLKHDAQLILFWNQQGLESAVLKFNPPRQIDRVVKGPPPNLIRVRPELAPEESTDQWYYAGSPEQGKLWKIFRDGMVESISWVRPFKNGPHENAVKSSRTVSGEQDEVAN